MRPVVHAIGGTTVILAVATFWISTLSTAPATEPNVGAVSYRQVGCRLPSGTLGSGGPLDNLSGWCAAVIIAWRAHHPSGPSLG